MNRVFVDTGAWIALMVQKDTHHVRAREYFRSIARNSRLITSNFVVAETMTWLAYHGHRREAIKLKDMLDASEQTRRLTMDWVTPDVHEYAWRIFVNWEDQDFSFCDCTSFVLARQDQVDYVFGFDHHFSTLAFNLRPHLDS